MNVKYQPQKLRLFTNDRQISNVDAWHVQGIILRESPKCMGTCLLRSLAIASLRVGLLGRLLVASGSLASIACSSLGPIGSCSGRLLSSRCLLLLLLIACGCLGWCVGLAGPCLRDNRSFQRQARRLSGQASSALPSPVQSHQHMYQASTRGAQHQLGACQ